MVFVGIPGVSRTPAGDCVSEMAAHEDQGKLQGAKPREEDSQTRKRHKVHHLQKCTRNMTTSQLCSTVFFRDPGSWILSSRITQVVKALMWGCELQSPEKRPQITTHIF